jgi:hypothetical protein
MAVAAITVIKVRVTVISVTTPFNRQLFHEPDGKPG